MNEPIEPLPPELSSLLDVERDAAFPRASLDRAWARIAHATAALPSGGLSPSPARAWIATHAAGVMGVTFALGLVAGAGIEHVRRTSPAATEVPRATIAPSVPVPPPMVSMAPPPIVETPLSVTPPASSDHVAPRTTLAAERALLDEARSALTAGDAARCLSLLDAHRARFPHPRLGEEREALATQALVALGRYDEARKRGAALRESAPNSIFLPVVDRALESIP